MGSYNNFMSTILCESCFRKSRSCTIFLKESYLNSGAVFSEKKWCFFGSKCLLPSYFLNLVLIIYLFTQSLIINHHPSTPKEDYRICGQNPMV